MLPGNHQWDGLRRKVKEALCWTFTTKGNKEGKDGRIQARVFISALSEKEGEKSIFIDYRQSKRLLGVVSGLYRN